jgi:hypothetical protein
MAEIPICNFRHYHAFARYLLNVSLFNHKGEFKSTLCRNKFPKILTKILLAPLSSVIHRQALLALFELVVDNGIKSSYVLDRRKLRILGYNILPRLKSFITSPSVTLTDLKYSSVMLLHQLSITEEAHKKLIDSEIIQLFGSMCSVYYGNIATLKLCLHSLVILVSSIQDEDFAKKTFETLISMQMISILSASLRNDDSELVSWSIFLIHEFSYRGIF